MKDKSQRAPQRGRQNSVVGIIRSFLNYKAWVWSPMYPCLSSFNKTLKPDLLLWCHISWLTVCPNQSAKRGFSSQSHESSLSKAIVKVFYSSAAWQTCSVKHRGRQAGSKLCHIRNYHLALKVTVLLCNRNVCACLSPICEGICFILCSLCFSPFVSVFRSLWMFGIHTLPFKFHINLNAQPGCTRLSHGGISVWRLSVVVSLTLK